MYLLSQRGWLQRVIVSFARARKKGLFQFISGYVWIVFGNLRSFETFQRPLKGISKAFNKPLIGPLKVFESLVDAFKMPFEGLYKVFKRCVKNLLKTFQRPLNEL